MAGLTIVSTKHKAVVFSLRSFAVACSSAALTLFTVVLALFLAVQEGQMDGDCAYKILPLAGTTFSMVWHLFMIVVLGSDFAHRIPRGFQLSLEAGICLMLAVLGYLSFGYDRADPEPGYVPAWGEQNTKVGAVTILSIACACHIGFFVLGLLSRPAVAERLPSQATESASGSIWKHTTITTTRSLASLPSRGQDHAAETYDPVPAIPLIHTAERRPSSRTRDIPNEDAPAYTPGQYQRIMTAQRSQHDAVSAHAQPGSTTDAVSSDQLERPTSPTHSPTASTDHATLSASGNEDVAQVSASHMSSQPEKQRHSRLFHDDETLADDRENFMDVPDSPPSSFFSAHGFSPAHSPTYEHGSSTTEPFTDRRRSSLLVEKPPR